MPEMRNLTKCLLIKYYVLSMPCESTNVVVRCVSPDIIFLDVKIE